MFQKIASSNSIFFTDQIKRVICSSNERRRGGNVLLWFANVERMILERKLVEETSFVTSSSFPVVDSKEGDPSFWTRSENHSEPISKSRIIKRAQRATKGSYTQLYYNFRGRASYYSSWNDLVAIVRCWFQRAPSNGEKVINGAASVFKRNTYVITLRTRGKVKKKGSFESFFYNNLKYN